MPCDTDVLIVGGGLAGLVCALHLVKKGVQVKLIEKHGYPQHKVCGEYISNEVLPYLAWLGADPASMNPVQISRLQLSTGSGKIIKSRLPLGGFGLSRYTLDKFLADQLLNAGGEIIQDTVTDISYANEQFRLTSAMGESYVAKYVIGAYGKRDTLDQKLARPFMANKSPWLAVKAHYRGNIPADLVSLHHFEGGYCGVSKVEDGLINVCYLVHYSSFKKYRSIKAHQQAVLYQNPHLKSIFESCVMHSEQPLSISQISFQSKEKVKDHILMIGDTAGLIHPLCGNGMSMAIHSAKLAAELLTEHFIKGILQRDELELLYQKRWKETFSRRIRTGRLISGMLENEKTSSLLLNGLATFPILLKPLIRLTHGKPLMT